MHRYCWLEFDQSTVLWDLKMYKKTTQEQCKLVKFKEVSDSIWVSFEAVIIEKTLKED